jgi:hypothetical protein
MATFLPYLRLMGERSSNIVNAEQLAWVDTAEALRAASPADRDRGQQFGARAKPLGRTAGVTRLGCTLKGYRPASTASPSTITSPARR